MNGRLRWIRLGKCLFGLKILAALSIEAGVDLLHAEHLGIYREYRRISEREIVAPALRGAVLIFFLLQTFVFIPADWLIFPDQFRFFLVARLALNVFLCFIYFWAIDKFPVVSSAAVCAAGAGLLSG